MTHDHVSTDGQLNIEIISLVDGSAPVDPSTILTHAESMGLSVRFASRSKTVVIGLKHGERVLTTAMPTSKWSRNLALAKMKALGCDAAVHISLRLVLRSQFSQEF